MKLFKSKSLQGTKGALIAGERPAEMPANILRSKFFSLRGGAVLRKTLCAALFGVLVLSTTAFASNFLCNTGNGSLVIGNSATADKKKMGVLVPIPESCTKSNICKFTYNMTITGGSSMPIAQNNNAYTTLPNANNISSKSGEYYAYNDGRGAAQCFLKGLGDITMGPDNKMSFSTTISISTTITPTGKSKTYWEQQGNNFN